MTRLPNDSAISVATSDAHNLEHRGSKTQGKAPKTTTDQQVRKSDSNSPHNTSPEPFPPTPQVAQELEAASAAEQAQNEIEIDSGFSDNASVSDAGYETDSLRSASTSISPSVRDYAFENGRRYHKFREGSYNFPNDDSEQDREDMKHAMMVNLCQRLHFADLGEKVGNGMNVLDMGTGTGIWAIEMGDLYPNANILGVDLSPIQPEWVPPNVKFMVDDVESPWLSPRNHFDYIHGRHTVMAIRDWPKLMRRVLEHLKPGGHFELQEIHHIPQSHDNSLPPFHPISEYWSLIASGLAALGVNFNSTLLLENLMIEAGFVNVTTSIFYVPIGTWPRNKVLKMVGLYWREILLMGAEPIALGPLTRGLGWSKEQVEVWLVEVRKAYADREVHAHMPLFIIRGQKPGSPPNGQ